MEVRKIYINDTARNNVITLETDATTFGEVKAAAIAAGVDIADKDWLEGITKTTPTSDDSLLPTNVSYRGQVTNDLVFLLTNTNKRIKSGTYSRSELYDIIKKNNYKDSIKKLYGRVYSSCTTADLLAFVEKEENKCYTKSLDNLKKSKLVNLNKKESVPNRYEAFMADLKALIAMYDEDTPKSLHLSVDEILNFK